MEFNTPGLIVCCQCGTSIQPNSLNMCASCMSGEVDITEGLAKSVLLSCCPKCERYNVPPNAWVQAHLESEELLSICLKRLKGLHKVHLVDAAFIWTEPHSRRLKVKLTIQKEVQMGAVLQQSTVVDYEIKSYQCPDCCRHAANDFWRALVQIRQKSPHKKTLLYLEQLIMKFGAHREALNMKAMHEGMDFYFGNKIHAINFQNFVVKRLPCTYHNSKTLMSSDIHNNTHNCKYTYCVEIPPVNKDDVIVLPKNMAQKLGNMGQICVVNRVVERIHLIDPRTCQVAEVDGKTFFANPFQTIAGPKMLTEFLVVETEVVSNADRRLSSGHSRLSPHHVSIDAYVMRSSQMDEQVHCRSHLGRHLKPGDSVLGFDLRGANVNSSILDAMKPEDVPDVILIKKLYADEGRRQRGRKWHLKRLRNIDDDTSEGAEFEDFKADLEEDSELRKGVNIYQSRRRQISMETDGTEDEDIPQIPLVEMLETLDLEGGAVGGADDQMME